LSITFRGHPKVVKLHKILGDPGIASLVTLWAHTAAYRHKGVLYDMDVMDVEIAGRWPGENGVLVRTLHDLRLLDCPACPPRESWEPHGIILPVEIHDWRDWQPWAFFSEERSERARSAAEARWGREDKKSRLCNPHKKKVRDASKVGADRNAKTLKTDAPSPSPSPSPEKERQGEEQEKTAASRPGAFEAPAAESKGKGKGNGGLPPLADDLVELVAGLPEMKRTAIENARLEVLEGLPVTAARKRLAIFSVPPTLAARIFPDEVAQ
jgi:hypothetical protein